MAYILKIAVIPVKSSHVVCLLQTDKVNQAAQEAPHLPLSLLTETQETGSCNAQENSTVKA